MAYIEDVIESIDKTHKSLGELVAMMQIVVKARKMMLVVSPSGCGKSRAMEFIRQNTPDAFMPDRLSIRGLANMGEKLTSFRSVVIVDDIANSQNEYVRKTTITTLSSLVYTHRIQSQMMQEVTIEDFYGAAILGIQPILLRDVMLTPEWDASIQDKVLRYYHVYRPIEPNLSLPDYKLSYGIDFEKVNNYEPDTKSKEWKRLIALGDSQWSRARTKEHMIDFLKAIAALNKRQEVISDDLILLARLLKMMPLESISVTKDQLEGSRQLDNNLLALLVEYYSYNGEYLLGQLTLDYHLTLSQAYRIMQGQNGYWQQISKSPTIYQPSKKLVEILKAHGLEVRK